MTVSQEYSAEKISTAEQNKKVIRRFIDGYNSRNMDVFEELVAPNYYDHLFEQEGRDKFKEMFTMAFKGFPDWYEGIEDIIAEGDKVWVWIKATGTHTNEWDLFGVSVPPTGNKIEMNMVFIWRLVDGKLAEGWEVDDNLAILKSIGVVDYTEEGKDFMKVFK
ncbi:ester cyclase [Candidatus Thorarchaeota archaeon]|nr:MAG: ester cyclase [Candidatus Thorarchaeota archaeon]